MGEQEMTRRDKRRLARHLDNVAARKRRQRSTGLHGRAAVSAWARDRWVRLQQLNTAWGRPELETEADRRKLIIAYNRELALGAGVSNAAWACMTRAERAALRAWRAHHIEDHPVAAPGTPLAGAFRKMGIRSDMAAA